MKLLYAEDEISMSEAVTDILSYHKYTVDAVYDGEEALAYARLGQYDGIILDIMMPGLSWLEVLRQLRGEGCRIPVLLLTAKSEVEDRIEGLDLGADDYLVKPFDLEELLARIRAMTRKRAGSRSNEFTIADLVVDIKRRTAARSGVEIPLIPKEFTILEYMIRNQGIVLSREQLENQIWNYEYTGSSNNMDVYISRLRKKIDNGYDKKLIHTIRGVGWVLRDDEQEESI